MCFLPLILLFIVLSANVYGAGLNEPIQPLPEVTLNADKVNLGQRLFNDKRLSGDNSVACASCHILEAGGADDVPFSTGVNGAQGTINTPTVLNSGFNFRQFWDARAATLEEQIDGPIHSPIEMGSNWPEIIEELSTDQTYRSDFAAVYADGIQVDNIKDAIAAFERSLSTPSRFDAFLQGDSSALSAEEQQGYELFKSYGCIACHQGVNVGGNMLQLFGVMGDYFADRGNITEADNGYFNVTGNERDRHKFKVPSLRNVALTSPYFHDSSAATLEDAVAVMVKYQLGRVVPEQDRDLIIKFLHTLTSKTLADQTLTDGNKPRQDSLQSREITEADTRQGEKS